MTRFLILSMLAFAAVGCRAESAESTEEGCWVVTYKDKVYRYQTCQTLNSSPALRCHNDNLSVTIFADHYMAEHTYCQ